ncbi:hypothetical protein CERSUDRAFT_104585 [Gelatoporia subvermispora B]|uniref:DUF6534 domain-containing protein n=1 Tax=Ceriporiopsis subvermispora (strain B) TaxID=914234 RepID=M2PS03_CERS8|nr:hypothetical protein CERSUDRAFT_104585 [Gelatoporia subvermispora B]
MSDPMSMSFPPALPASLIDSFIVPNGGGLLLAAVFSNLFYGITILQTYLYYDRYPRDSIYLKAYVALITAFDTAQQVFAIYSAWWYLVPNYGNLASTLLVPPGIGEDCAITVSMGLLVQGFFAYRVWTMSGRKSLVPIVIVMLSLTQFYYTVKLQNSSSIVTLAEVAWVANVGISCAMAGDFLITAAMCYYLSNARSGMLRTDKLINALVLYTVNTGLLTSINAICCIVLTTVFPKSFWLSIPFCLVSKCYVNSVLATLNARERLRNMSSGVTAMHTSELARPWSCANPSDARRNGASGVHFVNTGDKGIRSKASEVMSRQA